MKSRYLVLILIVLSSACTGQQHTDLQEQGVKGKVKMMAIENYFNVPVSLNMDSALLYEEDIFYYNTKGIIDSTLLLTGSGNKEDLKRYQKSTMRYPDGQKHELIYDFSSGQTTPVRHIRINDSTYQTSIYNKENAQTSTTTYYLDADFLVYKTEAVVLDSAKDTVLTQGTERYDKGSQGYYQKARVYFSDLDNGEKKIGTMVYSDFDKHSNPGKVILTQQDKPGKLEMRIMRYEYY